MTDKPGAIVFMHGLGDKPESWQDSIVWLAGKIGPNIKAVCPAAPITKITKNNGVDDMMTAWCDVFEPWPLTPTSKDDSIGLATSVATIHGVIDKLVAEGIPAERVVIGGFSQGAATAMLSVYTYSKTLGGCLNLSGWLADRAQFKAALQAANQPTPCHWAHGTQDSIVAFDNQSVGVTTLTEAGVPVVAKQYDLGHDTSEPEFDDILVFLQSRLG